VSAIFELQQKTGLKNVLLEKKLEKLSDLLEQREAQISEVLAAAQLDPAAVVNMNKKLEVHIKYNLTQLCELNTNMIIMQNFFVGYAQ